jgi:hypothetical protein
MRNVSTLLPAGMEAGGGLLAPMQEDILLTWCSIVMMTLKIVDVPLHPRVRGGCMHARIARPVHTPPWHGPIHANNVAAASNPATPSLSLSLSLSLFFSPLNIALLAVPARPPLPHPPTPVHCPRAHHAPPCPGRSLCRARRAASSAGARRSRKTRVA